MSALLGNIVVVVLAYLLAMVLRGRIANRYLRVLLAVAAVSLLVTLALGGASFDGLGFFVLWLATAAVPLLVLLVWEFIRPARKDPIDG